MLKKSLSFRQAGLLEGDIRGDEPFQEQMFRYGSLSQRVPETYPLRRVNATSSTPCGPMEIAAHVPRYKCRRPCLVNPVVDRTFLRQTTQKTDFLSTLRKPDL